MRQDNWTPQFEWMQDVYYVAETINLPHEDFPAKALATKSAIELFPPSVKNLNLLLVHKYVFSDKSFAGNFRNVRVQVGTHFPPPPEAVPGLMKLLEEQYVRSALESIEELKAWYYQFETIHPFQDGNGRVGGITVAIISHVLQPKLGWLTPLQ